MTRTDWVAVLSGLEPDDELTAALLALSDEDWLGEEAASLLRALAQREGGLVPYQYFQWRSPLFIWSREYDGYPPLPNHLPQSLWAKMDLSEGHLSVWHGTREEAWLALLKGLENVHHT